MSQQEAVWINFISIHGDCPAIKVSVGSTSVILSECHKCDGFLSGINAISGKSKTSIEPPDVEQDYIVAGLQPWLDGVMTDSGIVRQVHTFRFHLGIVHFRLSAIRIHLVCCDVTGGRIYG